MVLAKGFTAPVEPVQKTDEVVSERPFIPLVQKTTNATGQITQATQPIGAPSARLATQPVEAPSATTVMQPTGQDANCQIAADRIEVQLLGPVSQTFPGAIGRSEVQPPDPTS